MDIAARWSLKQEVGNSGHPIRTPAKSAGSSSEAVAVSTSRAMTTGAAVSTSRAMTTYETMPATPNGTPANLLGHPERR